eukprot:10939220-Alexandrium_andersonii.AAC.1
MPASPRDCRPSLDGSPPCACCGGLTPGAGCGSPVGSGSRQRCRRPWRAAWPRGDPGRQRIAGLRRETVPEGMQ